MRSYFESVSFRFIKFRFSNNSFCCSDLLEKGYWEYSLQLIAEVCIFTDLLYSWSSDGLYSYCAILPLNLGMLVFSLLTTYTETLLQEYCVKLDSTIGCLYNFVSPFCICIVTVFNFTNAYHFLYNFEQCSLFKSPSITLSSSLSSLLTTKSTQLFPGIHVWYLFLSFLNASQISIFFENLWAKRMIFSICFRSEGQGWRD